MQYCEVYWAVNAYVTLFMCFQKVRQGCTAFGSIHVIYFVVLENSMTLSILVFWYLIYWIHLSIKYWCECTNLQYYKVCSAADAYVTHLYVFTNSEARLYSIWINFMYSFMLDWKPLWLYLYLYFGTSYFGHIWA